VAIEYGKVDWQYCLEVLRPGASYHPAWAYGNEAEYDSLVWTDGRSKPTWAAICDVWVGFNTPGSGVLLDTVPPGARIFYPYAADFGNWLYVDPVNGRILDKATYAMLYKVVGDTYSGQYTGLTSTQFGLPKGIAGRVPVYTGTGFAYGAMGGESSHAISATEMPAHTHGLDANIVRQTAGLTLFGLGGVISVNPAGKISPASTGSAGTGTPMSLMQPWWSAGNLFIYRGKLKYDDMGGTSYL
jgi:microcystin-dependent protein